jgi:hypothetical protein
VVQGSLETVDLDLLLLHKALLHQELRHILALIALQLDHLRGNDVVVFHVITHRWACT